MSAAIRDGYKQTSVGLIPLNWQVKPMGLIGTLTMGKGLLKEDIKTSGRTPAIPYTALYTDFTEVLDYKGIKWFIDDEYTTHIANEPCVLIASSSNMAENTGKATALSSSIRVAIGREVIAFRTTSDSCYVSYLLSTATYRRKTLSVARGTTIKHVYPATFINYEIAVPPLAEQRAIAAALSDVDALLAKLDEFIAKKRDFKQAAMQQLLTGQTRLPGFTGKWEVKRLGDVLSRMANGAVYKPTNSLGIQITRIETIADGTIDYSRTGVAAVSPELDRYKIIPGDILFSHINSLDHIGKVAIFNGEQPLYHGMNLLLLRTNRDAHSHFLYFWFTSLPARRQTRNLAKQAVSQASINTKELKALEIRLPPLQEQTAIATVLSDMEAELTAIEARRDKTRALKQGMMQELLTGRIRLV